jgi:hypothetical protein
MNNHTKKSLKEPKVWITAYPEQIDWLLLMLLLGSREVIDALIANSPAPLPTIRF